MKKKILYLITKGNFGGAQRYVFDLSTNLPKDRFEIKVAYGEDGILAEKLKERDINTIKISSLQRNIDIFKELRSFFEILGILKKEKPDVLHINSSKAGGLGSLAGRIAGIKKIIYTVHGWPFKEPRNFLSRSIIWIVSYISALLSHKVIVISKEDTELGNRMPFIKRKLVHIYNGIKDSTVLEKHIARNILSKELSGIKAPWIGTIAELHPNKGLSHLLSAASKLKSNFILCIIGDGVQRDELKKTAKMLGILDKTIFTGFIKDAPRYLSALDLFILPSVKEGLPYTALEAGIRGIPVIGSDIAGIKEILEDEEMIFNRADDESMRKKIETALSNEDIARQQAKKLKERIEKEFSLSQMLSKTLELY